MLSMNCSNDSTDSFDRDYNSMSMSFSSMSLDLSPLHDLEWDMDDEDGDDGNLEPLSIDMARIHPQHDFQQERQQPKGVHFGEYVELELIEPLSEMPDDEKSAMFYARTEMEAIKQRERRLCKQLIYQSKNNQSSESQTSCVRGLDVFYPRRTSGVREKVEQVCHASRCRQVDAVLLAQIAEQSSEQDRNKAAANGLQDFYDAYFESSNNIAMLPLQQQQQQQQKMELTFVFSQAQGTALQSNLGGARSRH